LSAAAGGESANIRDFVSRIGIGAAASHFEVVLRYIEGTMGWCVRSTKVRKLAAATGHMPSISLPNHSMAIR
jgi:hypothetical protein